MSQPHTVVLIGAGHVHLYVAAHAETLVKRGLRVVLVDPDGFWYSGLATGMLGGMYESAEDRVAPQALMEAHGGEFIQDRVETVDAGARRLRLAGGGDLTYDYLSILCIRSLPRLSRHRVGDEIPGGSHRTGKPNRQLQLRRASGAVVSTGARCQELQSQNPAIGLGRQILVANPEHSRCFARGDRLLFYTPGMTEAVNTKGQQFDKSRLAAIACEAHHVGAFHLADHVIEQRLQFQHGTPPHDATLIVAELK